MHAIKRLISIFLMIAILLQPVPAQASSRKNTIYKVPRYNGFKSYERGILENGKIIFKKGTKQYRLQKMAKTRDGFRKVKGRYLIAVGSRFTKNIGQYVTLVLKNGTKIRCIVGDQKADADTDSTNTFSENECCSEFIVDIRKLDKKIREKGDVSHYKKKWNSPVSVIIVHDKNIFRRKKKKKK